jgi:hypothetical protein
MLVYCKKKGDVLMKPLKTKVSITLDSDVLDLIKELAEQDDRSLSQYINLVIKEHLKAHNVLPSESKKG